MSCLSLFWHVSSNAIRKTILCHDLSCPLLYIFCSFFTGVIKLCFRNTFSEAGFHYICGVINRYSGKIIDSNR